MCRWSETKLVDMPWRQNNLKTNFKYLVESVYKMYIGDDILYKKTDLSVWVINVFTSTATSIKYIR